MPFNNNPTTLPVDKQLPLSQAISYALPTVGIAFLAGPMAILQGIYTKYFGLSLSTIAILILIAKLFDAVSDPLIGILSDRYYSHAQGRKAFVLVGGVLFIISSYFLFVPIEIDKLTPVADSPIGHMEVSPTYFLGWFLAFYLAWTLFEIPHLAWGSELTDSAQGKNTIYGLRALGAAVGGLLFYAIPLLPFFETSQITPETLQWSVLSAAIILIPLLYFCIKHVPSGHRAQVLVDKNHSKLSRGRLIRFVLDITGNRPFFWFLAAFFFVGAGLGMWFGLLFIFVDIYLGLGDKFPLAFLFGMGASILALKFWYYVANYVGKKMTWALGMLVMIVGVFGSGFLAPGGSWLLLLFYMVMVNMGSAAGGMLAPSLLSDIIDYGTWKYSCDYGAIYFSLFTLVAKVNVAIGSALGLAVAGYYGFDATASFQSENSIFGLSLGIAWLPSVLIMIAIVCILLIPINARRHLTIRRRLDAM